MRSRARTRTAARIALCGALALAIPSRAGYVDPAASPSAHSIDYQMAQEMIRAQDWNAAIAHLSVVVTSESSNGDARYWLGFAKSKVGRHDEALASFRAAVELEPGHRAARAALGQAMLERGDRAGAQAELSALGTLCTDCDEYRALARALAGKR